MFVRIDVMRALHRPEPKQHWHRAARKWPKTIGSFKKVATNDYQTGERFAISFASL
jgi:hypothetical protein